MLLSLSQDTSRNHFARATFVYAGQSFSKIIIATSLNVLNLHHNYIKEENISKKGGVEANSSK